MDEILNIMTEDKKDGDIQTRANQVVSDQTVVNTDDEGTNDEREICQQEVVNSLKTLSQFASQLGNSDFFAKVNDLKMEYAALKTKHRKIIQSSIMDYFKI